MSVLGKQWVIKNTDTGMTLTEKLLHNRNLKTEDEIDLFLNGDDPRHLHDPFLMKDMEKATLRIAQSIKNKERIIVFGDYDVDGITGTAILVRILKKLGAIVSYRLPHRVTDGYGLREKFIREFGNLGVKVIITVDNGISCFKEIETANELGIDVIITDHHTIPAKIPNAYAILHPKLPGDGYPFDGLTGAGVAFKLAKALIKTLVEKKEQDALVMPLLDLACMGTIADLGPLRGENRTIVKLGLRAMADTRWPGLSRLKQNASVGENGEKISVRDIGFFLSPRLNAAGRISHSHFALQLLLDDGEKSKALANNLEKLNRQRQELVELTLERAFALGEEQAKEGQKMLVCFDPSWHSGILGLIASKLVDRFSRPAIAMEDRGEVLVGSARSVPGCNVVAAISSCAPLLESFGGHEQAAGFELKKENLQAFIDALHAYAIEHFTDTSIVPSIELECELFPDEIDMDTVSLIEQFEPFGMDNAVPKFLLRNVIPEKVTTVGKEGKHLKFRGQLLDRNFDCIGFRLGDHFSKIRPDSPLDLAVELEKNVWNGQTNLQLKLLDFRFA